MRILVVSNNYPSKKSPNAGVFVYNLIQEFVRQGNLVTVISVENISTETDINLSSGYGQELAEVYRPKCISASAKKIGSFNTYSISEYFQIKAIKKVVEKNNIKFDVVYAHFITNGIIAVRALLSYNKPIFTAIGESNIDISKSLFSENYFKKYISKISGFVSVSTKLKKKLLSFGVEEHKIIVKPNAVDLNKFRKQNKDLIRDKLGLPLNKKLIVFTGRFIHHKGPLRVLVASKNIENIGFIFVGSGNQILSDERIVFQGKVSSKEVPDLLSSADLFVLPTLKEGSCNAIVEAMACGLPIVSSDIPEVVDQCSPDFSILVNPLDTNKLGEAIHEILSDEQKIKQMSVNALNYSKKFDIQKRAKDILEFISK